LGGNVKLIRNFISLFWLGRNEMLRLFGGLGCKLLGAGGKKGE
jgi:hypothetical protein